MDHAERESARDARIDGVAPRAQHAAAASAASEWPAATAQRVPIVWTVEVGRWKGARTWEDAESRLIVAT